MNIHETIDILNDLIATTEDGKKGFSEAAQDVSRPDLKATFQKRAAECGTAAFELQSLVQSIGGKPATEGTLTGTAHRSWVKLRSTITDSDVAVLEEVERGEDHAKAVFSKALKRELPPSVRTVVQRHHTGTLRNHEHIRDLRNSYRSAASMHR